MDLGSLFMVAFADDPQVCHALQGQVGKILSDTRCIEWVSVALGGEERLDDVVEMSARHRVAS